MSDNQLIQEDVEVSFKDGQPVRLESKKTYKNKYSSKLEDAAKLQVLVDFIEYVKTICVVDVSNLNPNSQAIINGLEEIDCISYETADQFKEFVDQLKDDIEVSLEMLEPPEYPSVSETVGSIQ